MEAPSVTLVAIDDDPQCLELISEALAQPGLDILTAGDPEAGLALVVERRAQLVLLDLVLPHTSGMDMLERILHADPGIDVILMTAHYSTDSAVEAIRKGACDYITKPLAIAVLRQRVGRLLADARQRQRAVQLEAELLNACRFEDMVGRSAAMLEVFARIRRVAPHFRTVLITGPTGAGKELTARALHRLSPVAAGPFVACNCTAITESLFESELFGHVRGAFTGAVRDRQGLFEYAHGGALLLDEIGDLPPAMQGKLLRVLETQEVQRVGSPAARRVDVRVIAATNRDLRALMALKQFREDLFYRLSLIEVRLPALAGRKEDLPLLERHLLERIAARHNTPVRRLARRAQAQLAQYPWPGNVRELESALAEASMNAQGDTIDLHDLPERLRALPPASSEEDPELATLEEMERRHAARVLARTGGNKVRAAEILGISRATLYRILGERGDPAGAAGS